MPSGLRPETRPSCCKETTKTTQNSKDSQRTGQRGENQQYQKNGIKKSSRSITINFNRLGRSKNHKVYTLFKPPLILVRKTRSILNKN